MILLVMCHDLYSITQYTVRGRPIRRTTRSQTIIRRYSCMLTTSQCKFHNPIVANEIKIISWRNMFQETSSVFDWPPSFGQPVKRQVNALNRMSIHCHACTASTQYIVRGWPSRRITRSTNNNVFRICTFHAHEVKTVLWILRTNMSRQIGL